VILLVDGLELNSVIRVLPPACRASAVEVFFNVVPTETTDLVITRAGPEVQVRDIHLLEAERAFLVFRFVVAPIRVLYARKDAGFGLNRCGTGLENGGGQGRMSVGSGRHCLCLAERKRRALESETILNKDTLTTSDWEGDTET